MSGHPNSTRPGLTALFSDELRLLLFDRWLFALVTWLPVVLFLFMVLLFRQGIVHELPLAVVDYDGSSLSRSLIMALDGDDSLQVRVMSSEKDAVTALRRGQIYGMATIPSQFQQKVFKGLCPKLTTRYNYQYILVGKLLNSSMTAALATFNATLSVGRKMKSGNTVPLRAMGAAIPSQRQITALYNIGLNYGQFLVTALLPTIWQIIMVAATVMVWAAEDRRSSLKRWMQGPIVSKMLVRLFVYQVFFLVMSLFFLSIFHVMGWPMRGEICWVIFSQWLTILACQGMGTLFYLFLHNPAAALSATAAYTAPSFAFLGITFPVTDMDVFARFWSAILPVTHYMEVQISMLNYGANLSEILHFLLKQGCFLLVYLLIGLEIWRMRSENKGLVL